MNFKELAARSALELVQNDMTLGLGTGSTTAYFIDVLGERIQTGDLKGIRAVPTSEASAARSRQLGIPLVTLSECWQAKQPPPHLDLAVDGADEVDPQLNLIKGLGRALLREKIVAVHASRFVVIVDESKMVPRLGIKGPLPVEILPFEAEAHVGWLNSLGCQAELWLEEDGRPAITDNGNYLARCWFDGGIQDVRLMNRMLSDRPGIIEHGLFLDLATQVIVAGNGGVLMLTRPVEIKGGVGW
jgi:ribose 5-phosphate isomerase A